MVDPVVNKGKVTVSMGYDAAATDIVLQTGDGAKLPDPTVDGAYNLPWYDSSNYWDPIDDPNYEIVRVTGPAGTGDTKTIVRAQEGTGASTKNTSGATYLMFLGPTAKTITDLETAISAKIANILEDTTPQLGGNLEYNEKHQTFNRTLTSDNTASGDIIDVTFGESVVFGQVCYPDVTDNEWKLALATNVAVKHPAMGIALETKGNSEVGKLLLRGTIRDATYFSTAVMGDIVYLSDTTAGSVLYAAPSDSGDIVQILGFALENNYIFFNPDYTYVEIA